MFISTTPSAVILELVYGVNEQIIKYNEMYYSFVENVTLPNSMKNINAHCIWEKIKKKKFCHI